MRKFIIVLIVFISFLSGCSEPESQNGKRYVVTSPEIAEIIAVLEGVDNIVGITLECDFPESLQQKTKVGNFGKVDFEKIISLDPTIVFTSGLEQELLTSELNKLQIPTIQFYPRSIDEMLVSITEIGAVTGLEKRAAFVADSLSKEIKRISTNSRSSSPSVYVEIYNQPIMSVSDSSFIGEVIQLAGGDNIFSNLPRDYSRVNPEEVIKKDPDIIILTYPYESAVENIKQRKGWEVISAIKNDMIFTTEDLDPDLIIRATPRIISGIEKIRQIINDQE